MKCENARCPSTSPPPKLFLCGGCSTVEYCSKECQLASWTSHKQVCKLYPPPSSLSGIRLRVVRKEGKDNVGPLEEETEYSALQIFKLEILHIEGENLVKAGVIEIYVIDIPMMHRNGGFFDCLNEYTHDLGLLALHFDHMGYLHPNRGCWQPEDFEEERFLVYLKEVRIEEEWRGKGLSTWLLPRLFHLRVLNGAQYIFSWPTVLNSLEPTPINGMFGDLTPAEVEARLRRQERIIKIYRKVGFRRLANAEFFCLAEWSGHPSHFVAVEEDAPFEDLPPATTEHEKLRRYMAFN